MQQSEILGGRDRVPVQYSDTASRNAALEFVDVTVGMSDLKTRGIENDIASCRRRSAPFKDESV